MTTILLLDSDAAHLKEAVSELRAARPEWTIYSAETTEDALELCIDLIMDVVISDTQVEEYNGIQLFDSISSIRPDTIRIALSADLKAEIQLECHRSAHRFIAKPLDTEKLINSVEHSLLLRKLLNSTKIQTFMEGVESVPAIPTIYDEMMRELASPNSSLMKIGDIVETDAGLTVTVLKIVNSAFYGLNSRVESVAQAVTLLGVHLIKNITLTAKVFSKFEGSTLSLKKLNELNDEAMRMGAIANQFARFARLPKGLVDHCQIAGMMANVGALIAAVKKEDQENDEAEIESQLLGAYLLRSWKMPDGIVEAVALQYKEPPPFCGTVSPLIVLHSIRYLQAHFVDTQDEDQRATCRDYLNQYLPETTTDRWIEAFQDIQELTGNDSQEAA